MQCFLLGEFVSFFVFCVFELRLLSYFKPLICVLTTVFLCVYKLHKFNCQTCEILHIHLLCVNKNFVTMDNWNRREKR